MSYYAGKNGSVKLGSTSIPVKNWKVTHSIQELDTTTTGSNGFYEVQGGIEKLEGTFEAQWDANQTNSPFASGFNFKAGALLTNLKLYTNATDLNGFTVSSAFVKSNEVDLGVDAVVKYTVSFTSTGSYVLPS